MPKIQKNFIKGRMNKSVDERLVPQGEYIDALNVRLGSTEGTEIGAVENSKGNELLVQVLFQNASLSNEAKCIGAYEDGANETIYWFIHDKNNLNSSTGKVDLIVSYNVRTFALIYHVISTSILNFDEDYLVNGIDLIGDLLFFTDNLNPPRKINITRTYLQPDPNTTVDQITEQDIGVILAPPLNAPTIQQFQVGGGENYMEEILISFAYRWQYEDGEYSALSPFSQYSFTPGPFNFDYSNYNQEGMRNVFNSVSVSFDTGGKNVKDIDVVFKFSTSQSVNVIERFNKVNEGWLDDIEQSITFTNKKIYTTLPEEQLLRLYDNVPLKAQAQTIMGNRLMYGNYIDGYDIVNEDGADIYLDYDLELISESLASDEITGTLSNFTYSIDGSNTINNATLTVDFGGDNIILEDGAQIGVDFTFVSAGYSGDPSYDDGTQPENEFVDTFIFTLQQDYSSVYEMAISPEFIAAVEEFVPLADNPCIGNPPGTEDQGTSLTDTFICGAVPKNGFSKVGFGLTASPQGILIGASQGSTEISFTLPALKFQEFDQTVTPPVPVVPEVIAYEYLQCISGTGLYSQSSSKGSLHSNRDYEIGVVYMDEYGRSSTALVDTNNTVFVPCDRSINKNSIRVTMNSYPPYWATKYKFVIKESKGLYRTIYSNIFFREEETGDVYYLLDGDNRDKVKDNSVLYIKSDTNGPVLNCASTKVLGFGSEAEDFLCRRDADDNVIEGTCGQPTGTYMKLKPSNFAANKPPNAFVERPGSAGSPTTSYPVAVASLSFENPDWDGSTAGQEYIDIDIPAGSLIRIKFDASRRRRGSSCGSRKYLFEKDFVASTDYDNLHSFVIGDRIDLTAGITSGDDDSINVVNQYDDIKGFADFSVRGTNEQSYVGFQRQDANSADGRPDTNQLFFWWSPGTPRCKGIDKRGSYANINITIERAPSLTVFETEPLEANDELYYENNQTFDIVDGYHMSGTSAADQNQTASQPAIVDLTFFNCYTFGNGVEENFVLSGLTKPYIQLGEKVTSVSEEQYQQANRFADITYSGVFNQETNLNKLNQFNLALANFKTLETSYGPIRKMHARQTDILTLQEDKISYVLVGKNLLSDAAAGGAITSVPEVLGTQLARIEEYGISNNPESFTSYGYDVFFTDAKRSSVIQLKGGSAKTDQLGVISQVGMRSWFRDLFTTSFETQKLGGFDPYMNEYVLSSNTSVVPQQPIERACGYSLSLQNTSDPYELFINLTTLIGDVQFDYNVTGQVNITVEYNGIEVVNQDVSGIGFVTFTKNQNNPTNAKVVITPLQESTYMIDFNCPEADTITVKEIVINFSGDASLTTTTRYRWELGADTSPYSTNVVVLEQDGVSLFSESTGQASFGALPPQGATVTMQSRRAAGQTYYFKQNSNKFKYFASNSNFNEVDIPILIPLLQTATPISGGPDNYEASFVYTTATNYLYLVWDLREAIPIELCYDATSSTDACCECVPPGTFEILQCLAPGSGLTPTTAYATGSMEVGDIVLAQAFGEGGDTCHYSVQAEAPGETNTVAFIEVSPAADCTETANEYIVSNTNAGNTTVSYFDCDGIADSETIGPGTFARISATEFTSVPAGVTITLDSCGCATTGPEFFGSTDFQANATDICCNELTGTTEYTHDGNPLLTYPEVGDNVSNKQTGFGISAGFYALGPDNSRIGYMEIGLTSNVLSIDISGCEDSTITLTVQNNITGDAAGYTIGGDPSGTTKTAQPGGSSTFTSSVTLAPNYTFSSAPVFTWAGAADFNNPSNKTFTHGYCDETKVLVITATVTQQTPPPSHSVFIYTQEGPAISTCDAVGYNAIGFTTEYFFAQTPNNSQANPGYNDRLYLSEYLTGTELPDGWWTYANLRGSASGNALEYDQSSTGIILLTGSINCPFYTFAIAPASVNGCSTGCSTSGCCFSEDWKDNNNVVPFVSGTAACNAKDTFPYPTYYTAYFPQSGGSPGNPSTGTKIYTSKAIDSPLREIPDGWYIKSGSNVIFKYTQASGWNTDLFPCS